MTASEIGATRFIGLQRKLPMSGYLPPNVSISAFSFSLEVWSWEGSNFHHRTVLQHAALPFELQPRKII